MYLHLGHNVVVMKKNVIGIFDLDNASSSQITRAFLARAEKEGRVVDISGELPKVFAVCDKNGESTVYLSQLSSATLLRRLESDEFDGQ
jgi:hypothetical protein